MAKPGQSFKELFSFPEKCWVNWTGELKGSNRGLSPWVFCINCIIAVSPQYWRVYRTVQYRCEPEPSVWWYCQYSVVTICSGQLQHHQHQPASVSDKQRPAQSRSSSPAVKVMQLKVSEGKQSLEEAEETGPGTKLGIVKLGKVAGKVSLGSYV